MNSDVADKNARIDFYGRHSFLFLTTIFEQFLQVTFSSVQPGHSSLRNSFFKEYTSSKKWKFYIVPAMVYSLRIIHLEVKPTQSSRILELQNQSMFFIYKFTPGDYRSGMVIIASVASAGKTYNCPRIYTDRLVPLWCRDRIFDLTIHWFFLASESTYHHVYGIHGFFLSYLDWNTLRPGSYIVL